MPSPKIFVGWPDYAPDDAETGKRAGDEIALHPRTANRTAEELDGLLGDAVGAIASTDSLPQRSSPDRRQFKRLGQIASRPARHRKHGVAIQELRHAAREFSLSPLL